MKKANGREKGRCERKEERRRGEKRKEKGENYS